MKSFVHLAPKTIQEACSLLSKYKSRAAIIAGGTDLVVLAKSGEVTPEYVISLEAIPDLDYINFDGKTLRIGALTTVSAIESSPIVRENFPILADAAHQMGSPQVRNMATVAGNLCHASPSADMAPTLLASGAKMKLAGARKERLVDLEDFFIGPGQTVLADTELLTEVQVPAPHPQTYGTYLKMAGRAAAGIAQVGVAAVITFDAGNNTVSDIRIVLGAVAPTAVRAVKAESLLKGKVIDDRLVEQAAGAAADAARPISDIRATAEYRREMVRVLVSRAIRQIARIK